MEGRFQAGRPLTLYHATSTHTVTCRRCRGQLDVRVSAKGYPGQEREDTWLDCPACGEEAVTVVAMPDTGGADIRVTPLWRRLLSSGLDVQEEDAPLLWLLGVLLLSIPLVRWLFLDAGYGLLRAMRDGGVAVGVGVASWLAMTRGPVRRWSRGDPDREQLVWQAGITTALAATLAATVLLSG